MCRIICDHCRPHIKFDLTFVVQFFLPKKSILLHNIGHGYNSPQLTITLNKFIKKLPKSAVSRRINIESTGMTRFRAINARKHLLGLIGIVPFVTSKVGNKIVLTERKKKH